MVIPGWTTEKVKPVVKINDLPDEVLVQIFSHLAPDDMARSALVCERWRYLLKGQKELWRGKEWFSGGSEEVMQRFLAFCVGIPRLRSVRLLYDGGYGIRVAWPDVTVYLRFATAVRWEPYFRRFNTESLVVSSTVAHRISNYVECTDTRTLRRICVVKQAPVFHWPRIRTYFPYGPARPHDSYPVWRPTPRELAHSEERCYGRDDPVAAGVPTESEPEGAAAPEADAYGCPALEVVNVHCSSLSETRLAELCALGPVRKLRIESRGTPDLWALRGLGSHLQELSVADCGRIKCWDYRELRGFVGLRVLRLGKSRLEEAELRDLTAGMPHLRTLTLNRRELLTQSH